MRLIRRRYNPTHAKGEKLALSCAGQDAGHPQNSDLILEVAARAAVHQTGASAAAIALLKNETLVCRARVGCIAPDLGLQLDVNRGITGACVRSRAVMYCADTETDPRVDGGVCRTLGIRSVLVVPVLADAKVVGVVEVLSAKDCAFKTEHIQWLRQLADFLSKMSVEVDDVRQAGSLLPPPHEDRDLTGQDGVFDPTMVTIPTPPDQSPAVFFEAGLAAFLAVLPKGSQSSTWDEMSEALTARLKISRKT